MAEDVIRDAKASIKSELPDTDPELQAQIESHQDQVNGFRQRLAGKETEKRDTNASLESLQSQRSAAQGRLGQLEAGITELDRLKEVRRTVVMAIITRHDDLSAYETGELTDERLGQFSDALREAMRKQQSALDTKRRENTAAADAVAVRVRTLQGEKAAGQTGQAERKTKIDDLEARAKSLRRKIDDNTVTQADVEALEARVAEARQAANAAQSEANAGPSEAERQCRARIVEAEAERKRLYEEIASLNKHSSTRAQLEVARKSVKEAQDKIDAECVRHCSSEADRRSIATNSQQYAELVSTDPRPDAMTQDVQAALQCAHDVIRRR